MVRDENTKPTSSDVVNICIQSDPVEEEEHHEKIELCSCTGFWMIVLSILGIWFVILVFSIIVNIGFSIVGIPTPKTEIGKIVNSSEEELTILFPGKKLKDVDILMWPRNGLYPTTYIIGSKNVDLIDDPIEGKYIQVYRENDIYAVDRHCGYSAPTGNEPRHLKCTEITTSVVYYFTDGYMTTSWNSIFVLLIILGIALACAMAISCIVVPIWGVIGLCFMLLCNNSRCCREWCRVVGEANTTSPSV